MDIPRIFNITENAHRIHNPITPEKLATLGAALRLESGARVLDLGSGSGEMLCTWARDHGVIGTGIDMSQLFTEEAKLRAVELGVADQVKFIHGDAAGYISDEKASVAACVGAAWIAGGVAGTIELLARSLRSGGIILIGEPYWRQLPPTEDVAKGCLANSISDFLLLPELLASFGHLGYDVVELRSLIQEIWRLFLAAMIVAMVVEAGLCLPKLRQTEGPPRESRAQHHLPVDSLVGGRVGLLVLATAGLCLLAWRERLPRVASGCWSCCDSRWSHWRR